MIARRVFLTCLAFACLVFAVFPSVGAQPVPQAVSVPVLQAQQAEQDRQNRHSGTHGNRIAAYQGGSGNLGDGMGD